MKDIIVIEAVCGVCGSVPLERKRTHHYKLRLVVVIDFGTEACLSSSSK